MHINFFRLPPDGAVTRHSSLIIRPRRSSLLELPVLLSMAEQPVPAALPDAGPTSADDNRNGSPHAV